MIMDTSEVGHDPCPWLQHGIREDSGSRNEKNQGPTNSHAKTEEGSENGSYPPSEGDTSSPTNRGNLSQIVNSDQMIEKIASNGLDPSPEYPCEASTHLQSYCLTPPLEAPGVSLPHPGSIYKILSLFRGVTHGGDLTQFRLPAQYKLPKSQLQLYGESLFCGSSHLLDDCARPDLTSLQRILAVVRWHLSTTRMAPPGRAPLNPVLGETHHVSRGSLNVMLEQVSHHPPETALYATNHWEEEEAWKGPEGGEGGVIKGDDPEGKKAGNTSEATAAADLGGDHADIPKAEKDGDRNEDDRRSLLEEGSKGEEGKEGGYSTLWWHRAVPRFFGNGIAAQMQGWRRLHLRRWNETFLLTCPSLNVRFFPFPGPEWVGRSRVVSDKNPFEAVLDFKPKGLFGFHGEKHRVEGRISESGTGGRVVATIHGKWDSKVWVRFPTPCNGSGCAAFSSSSCSNGTESGNDEGSEKMNKNCKEREHLLFDHHADVVAHLATPQVLHPEGLSPCESVVVWRSVMQHILDQKWREANEEKEELEEGQREDGKERDCTGVEWRPKYFVRRSDVLSEEGNGNPHGKDEDVDTSEGVVKGAARGGGEDDMYHKIGADRREEWEWKVGGEVPPAPLVIPNN